MDAIDRPLAGIVVLDLLDAPLSAVTRTYVEFGAEVIRPDIVPDGDVRWLAANIGKTIVAPGAIADAANRADIVIQGPERGDDYPAATVVMTVSMFGANNSLSDWQATDPVLHALTGVLSRSGLEGREPLLPPGELALECGMAQAAYVGLAAVHAAKRTGKGDRLDVSLLEAALQALDPGFGISGSATLGRAAKHLPPGRPIKGFQYPILPCADGDVRLCVLAPRQWQNLFRWMGEPPEFAGDDYNKTAVRQQSQPLLAAIQAFVGDKTRLELAREGTAHGVPISGILSIEETLDAPHIAERGAVGSTTLPSGETLRLPNGVIEIDGARMSAIDAAPSTATFDTPHDADPARPFAGLKVLDLGVIVVGGEQSRLLADMGADVVKVESAAFPDGTRHSYLPTGLSVIFASGHRNKRSLGLNLRHPEGKALFRRLAAEADVILSNFKPGTMESLGFGYDEIAAINPGIIMVESSAFGSSGPWAGRMGYGPLVRAAAGLTAKWRYPDDPTSYSDSITIYPDHVGARYGTMAILALLTRRLRTGRGGRASISQMEVMLSHFAAEVAGADTSAPDAPWGVYQAAGIDQWCVVTVRNDSDWGSLAKVMGRADWLGLDFATAKQRRDRRADIDRDVAAWMATQDADAAMHTLQAAGVPAAHMLRVADLPDFAYYRERDFFRVDRHPHMDEPIIAERRHTNSALLAEADARPAPLAGEHSGEVVRDWLGLDTTEVDRLIADGVLEPIQPSVAALIAAGEGRSAA